MEHSMKEKLKKWVVKLNEMIEQLEDYASECDSEELSDCASTLDDVVEEVENIIYEEK